MSTARLIVSKAQTDDCYNNSIDVVLKTLRLQLEDTSQRPIPALSVIFGTHNTDSLTEIFDRLEGEGLASKSEKGRLQLRSEAVGRIAIAQLYGEVSFKQDLMNRHERRSVR